MKKFAIGCAIVLAIVMVVGGIGLYVAYDRLIKPGIAMAGSIKELAKLGDIEKQVRNTESFSAPDNGELTQAMVDRFVKVQQQVEKTLGPRMTQLKESQAKIDRAMEGEKRSATIGEIATSLKELASLVIEAKRAQVEALNQSNFSVREYEWVRSQVYAAVGMPTAVVDLKKMAEDAKAGDTGAFTPKSKSAIPDAPARNKTLVAPYEKQLKDWAALAFFGL